MAKTPQIDLREDYQRNYIINGNFDFWQRGTSATYDGNTVGQLYLADRFRYFSQLGLVIDVSRSTDVPSGTNASYSLLLDRTSSSISIANNTLNLVAYSAEGYDIANLIGKTVTLSFWVKASAAGDQSLSIRNPESDRSFVHVYNIAQADTWEKKTFTFHLENTSWEKENQAGMIIRWIAGAGSDFTTSTTEQWITGDVYGSSAITTDLLGDGGYIQLAQVQLTEGAEELPFRRAGRNYAEEFRLCQRYYETSFRDGRDPSLGAASLDWESGSIGLNNSIDMRVAVNRAFSTEKRANPTFEVYDFAGTADRLSVWNAGVGTPVNGVIAFNKSASKKRFYVRSDDTNNYTSGFRSWITFGWTADAEL